jgi:hypothetical protein
VEDKRIRKIFAFANNHYAGHAPATVKQFWELWNRKQTVQPNSRPSGKTLNAKLFWPKGKTGEYDLDLIPQSNLRMHPAPRPMKV